MRSSILLSAIVLAAFSTFAAPGDLDLTFSGDGKLLDFLSRGDDYARGVAVQSDGKIVVAGTSWTGVDNDFAIARYNTDGSLDTSFGIGGKVTTDFNSRDDYAHSIALQADGKIVLAGESHLNFALARYNPDGSLDNTFGTGGKLTTAFGSGCCTGTAYSVAIQVDGRIVAAGQSRVLPPGGIGDFAVARYNPDGSLDTSFDGDGKVMTDIFDLGDDVANSVAIHSNGKIVAAGRGVDRTSNTAFITLVQYNPDGSLDTSFDGDGKATTQVPWSGGARSVAIQADGKMVAAVGVGFGLVRFSTTGFVEDVTSVPIGTAEGTESVAIQPDGKIVAAGFCLAAGNFGFAIVRLNANFSIDTTFANNGRLITLIGSYAWGRGIALQTDGKVVVAGESSGGESHSSDFAVVRHRADGWRDSTFRGDGRVATDFGFAYGNVLQDAVVQPDGKVVASGAVRGDFAVLRYNEDGTPDTAFGAGTGKVRTAVYSNDGARAVAIQTDGKIVVAGGSSDWDGNDCCFALARYNADGSLDTTFEGDGIVITGSYGTYAGAYDIAIQPDGKIVAAGYDGGGFAVYRYNTDGSLDTSFGGDGMVTTAIGSFFAFAKDVSIQPDGKIVAAGSSSSNGYYDRDFAVVRYNGDGSLDSSFGTGGIVITHISQPAEVYSSVHQTDGKIIVAGSRSIILNETSGLTLIRYNTNGSLDTTFGTGGIVTTQVGLNSGAHAITLQPDGKIVASGTSSGIGNSGDFAVVRYDANGSLDTSFGGGDGISTVDLNNNSSDYANGMALDGQGRAVVVGSSDGAFALARFYTSIFGIGFEADVAPRNSGDGVVTSPDVTQLRRFVTGLDTLSSDFNELQRTDSAPRSTQGDRLVTSADVIQARRYATGLDPLTDAGGPFAAALPPPETHVHLGGSRSDGIESSLLVGRATVSDRKVTVPIELTSRGDVIAAGLTLDYDFAMLSIPRVTLANGMPADVVLTLNTNDPGQIRVLVDSSQPLLGAKSEGPIVFVTFDILEKAGVGQRWLSSIHLSQFDLSDVLEQIIGPSGR